MIQLIISIALHAGCSVHITTIVIILKGRMMYTATMCLCKLAVKLIHFWAATHAAWWVRDYGEAAQCDSGALGNTRSVWPGIPRKSWRMDGMRAFALSAFVSASLLYSLGERLTE